MSHIRPLPSPVAMPAAPLPARRPAPRRWWAVAAAGLMLLGAAALVLPAVPPALDVGSTSAVHVDRDGLALRGHDPVLLAEEGRAVPGRARHAWVQDGAPYRFASEATLARFRADPLRYLPAYGGFSAAQVAEGRKAAGDPRHATRAEGRVFLHRDAAARRAFEADLPAAIARADAAWPAIRHRTPRALDAAAR